MGTETDTRSVAEILGWKLGHEKRWTFDDETWYFIPDECDANGDPATRLGGPTVDDMLAWLRERDRQSHEVWCGDDQVHLRIEYKSTHDDFTAPTLHAALEAAVRAVAAT